MGSALALNIYSATTYCSDSAVHRILALTVKVHYVGSLLDGTEFDSSVKRGQPAEFALDSVIPGWSEGVQLMRVGGKARLHVPSELAYGDRGVGPIPPGSVLVFELELVEIVTP